MKFLYSWTLLSLSRIHRITYFGNSTLSILTACCYTKSLENEDSLVVISESKDHNRAEAITCVKKVIEKAGEINAASYGKNLHLE